MLKASGRKRGEYHEYIPHMVIIILSVSAGYFIILWFSQTPNFILTLALHSFTKQLITYNFFVHVLLTIGIKT